MKEKMYGYIRVSTKDQNEARQLAAMQAFGVCEKIWSWKNFPGRIFVGRCIKS